MNERIKELAEQCEGMTICECGSTGFNYEKFAELIVQDCANFVREEYDHEHAEGIAWMMEVKFGLHGDYA